MTINDLLASRTVQAQLLAVLFVFAHAAGLHLPMGVDEVAFTGTGLLVLAAVTAAMRFGHDGAGMADAKAWYLSKTIWTQIIAAAFAVLTMVGAVPVALDQASVTGAVMTVVALVNIALRRTRTVPIARVR